jgi:hypothetical protein
VTIQDLGSIGELVAAIATIVTLAYLALQIRKNTITTKSEADRASRTELLAFSRLIVGDENVARIYTQGLADPNSLTPEELVRFRFLISGFMMPLIQAYKEWKLGVSDEQELLQRIEPMKSVFLTPGGQLYWQGHRESTDHRQREYFDSHFT